MCRYSGSLEWRNAIVLWVNVGGADYNNQFFFEPATGGQGLLKMTWFSGSRMHADTPVIRRLMLAVKASKKSPETAILLFCRGVEGTGYGKYVFCGRVKPRGTGGEFCDLSARPMRFVWALEDWPSVSQQEGFPQMLREGGFSA